MDYEIILFRVLPAFLTSLVISLIAMPSIIQVSSIKKLMDEPDNKRKLHNGFIPTLGGIGIFTAFLISFSVWGDASSLISYPFFVAALFMLFLIGIKDDILVISPVKKMAVQILAATELVVGGGVYLNSLEGVFGIYQISNVVGIILTVLIFMVLINSYNLIDGIDGLAGGVGVVISSILGGWFLLSGFYTMAILAFVLVGALGGFLYYNYHPAKIFMGDTGAMAVGFILTYMIIQFILFNQAHPTSVYYVNNAPIFALSLLIIPVVDTLRVFVLRVSAGKNPLEADYNHLHHQCLKEGMAPGVASLFLWICNVWVIILAYYFNFLGANLMGLIVLTAGFTILLLVKPVQFLLMKFGKLSYLSFTQNTRDTK